VHVYKHACIHVCIHAHVFVYYACHCTFSRHLSQLHPLRDTSLRVKEIVCVSLYVQINCRGATHTFVFQNEAETVLSFMVVFAEGLYFHRIRH